MKAWIDGQGFKTYKGYNGMEFTISKKDRDRMLRGINKFNKGLWEDKQTNRIERELDRASKTRTKLQEQEDRLDKETLREIRADRRLRKKRADDLLKERIRYEEKIEKEKQRDEERKIDLVKKSVTSIIRARVKPLVEKSRQQSKQTSRHNKYLSDIVNDLIDSVEHAFDVFIGEYNIALEENIDDLKRLESTIKSGMEYADDVTNCFTILSEQQITEIYKDVIVRVLEGKLWTGGQTDRYILQRAESMCAMELAKKK